LLLPDANAGELLVRRCEMNTDEKQFLLAEHLDEFRKWTYEALVEEIDRTKKEHDCLRHIEGVYDDGTEYQMEFNVFWDGKRGGDVRVCGDITTAPQNPALGFVPVYTSDATDSFIMTPDGRFVGE
jgi:hypothetical protein